MINDLSNIKHFENMELAQEKQAIFSNASGDSMPARNAACHFKCNFKVKSKRAACWQDCDKRFPKSEKQDVRRDERSVRRTARNLKGATIDDCKADYKNGLINKSEESFCIKNARVEKRDTIKEDGGGRVLTRIGRGFTKVNPITATARGGALLAIKKVNVSGFATRLAPALVSESEAKNKFTPEAIALSKKGWLKVKKSWRNLGGNEFNLRDAILEGYNKKPEKLPRKTEASFNGEMSEETHSNVVDWMAVGVVGSLGLSLIGMLVNAITKMGVKKNPYKQNTLPTDYRNALNSGDIDENIAVDPNDPIIDPRTGGWIDPNTGRPVDPKTGQQLILGMNPYLAIGLGTVAVVGLGIGIYKLAKK